MVAGATGYNVYVDGVKNNTSLITATNYYVNGLTNGIQYAITVTAVNDAGESLLSDAYDVTPTVQALPIIKLVYTLSDVAEGVGNWFSSIWLILAFSIAIPLSFLIGRRIKDLFA
jgi:hypothetical protein